MDRGLKVVGWRPTLVSQRPSTDLLNCAEIWCSEINKVAQKGILSSFLVLGAMEWARGPQ